MASSDKALNATAAIRYLQAEAPDASTWFIDLPNPRSPALEVSWPDAAGGDRQTRIVDVATGTGITPRASEGGEHFGHFHADLHSGMLGVWLVGLSGLLMLVAVISRIIVHKRIFTDFFTFLSYVGAAGATLGMSRHYVRVRGQDPAPIMAGTLRIGAAACWTAALFCCVFGWGGAMGAVAWFGLFAAGALCWIVVWSFSTQSALIVLALACLGGMISLFSLTSLA